VDVSGHRIGSAWVALLFMGLAMRPPEKRAGERTGFLPALTFRILGLMAAAVASWWFASLRGFDRFPTSVTLERFSQRIGKASANQDFSTAQKLVNAALKIGTLDWTLYFQRGATGLAAGAPLENVVNDFQLARFLQPNWVNVCMDEGSLWLAMDQPDLCAEAWAEALRRARGNGPVFFKQMLDASRSNPAVRDALRNAARLDPNYLLVFLDSATRAETETEISIFLIADPELSSLSAGQRKRFFSIWWQRGNKTSLAEGVLAHESWQAEAWSFLAEYFAEAKDYERAWATAMRFAKAPAIPQMPPGKPLADLEREFFFGSDDFLKGFAFCAAQIRQGRIDEALATIRELKKIRNHPRYISYLEAELCGQQKQWERAWMAWREFAGSSENRDL
jgi:hypothetical protein